MANQRKFIYLDHNATGIPVPDEVLKEIAKWTKNGFNPSTDSKYAKDAKELIEKAKSDILARCGVSSLTHKIIFTSGATESNCFIIRACVTAFAKKIKSKDLIPHIVVSSVEHTSIIECVNKLVEAKEAEATFVRPTIIGNINPKDVEAAIRPTTCIVCVMFANNEIPVINNVRAIAEITRKKQVAYHCDCVQVFGKFPIKVAEFGLDSISASAHKFCGPKGIGISIISNQLIEEYGLVGEINGTQQNGLRGGTENVPGIGGTLVAYELAHKNRDKKNTHLLNLRRHMIELLKANFNIGKYENYALQSEQKKVQDFELLFLGPQDERFCLLNTLLLAFCKNTRRPFCNIELKRALDAKSIIVSIGSACNTSSSHASHTLVAIGAPQVVKQGVIRVSMGDSNTKEEVEKFVAELVKCVKKQVEKEIAIKAKEISQNQP